MVGPPPTTEFDPEQEHLDEDRLSAYLNGDMELQAPGEVELVRAHLRACADCRERLADLRAVVSLLGTLEQPQLPRSFRLDPSMVPASELAPTPVRALTPEPWYIRFQPALRRLTAVAAMLLVAVVAGDLLLASESAPSARDAAVQRSAPGGAATSLSSGAAPASGASAAESGKAATAPAGGGSTTGGAASSMMQGTAASPAAAAARAATDLTPTPAAAAAPASMAATVDATATLTPADASTQATSDAFQQGASAETEAPGDSRSIWRLAELALALTVLWLLVATVALPRLRRPVPAGQPDSEGRVGT